ncbi:MAG: DMT family transporter, partial [Blastocatellia bacterium]|nr:DMT family transporter [Blastocatellia bacterium]
MKSFYFPIALVVGGNILYHISQKSIPKSSNPFTAMMVAYAVAFFVCLIGALFYPAEKISWDSIEKTNWAICAVGLGIAAVEIGFLFAYRVGWNISVAPLVSSILITLLLIPVGLLAFKEELSA